MKKKTVLHVISNLGIGGAQAVIANICNEMQKLPDWKTCVVPLEEGTAMLPRIHEGVTICTPIAHRRRYYLRTIIRLCTLIIKINPDVLHLHLWLPKQIGTICGVICGVPLIISTEHSGSPWTTPVRQTIDRFLSGFINRRIMVCSYIEDLFLNGNICSNRQSEVLFNPVPSVDFTGSEERKKIRATLGIPAEAVVFLFVGALRKVKNITRLLKAFRTYVNLPETPPSHLIVVGDGPELSDSIILAKHLEIEKCVNFELARIELDDYYKVSDIFVMTSEVEGFPVALAEAMHHGVVPVCTKTGGIPELIKEGYTGFFLDMTDCTDDGRRLLMVANSPEIRKKVGNNAQEFVRELTSPAEYIGKLVGIYSADL